MSFSRYMVGFAILILGLGIAAYLMHVPSQWIGVGVICLIGLGILLGVKNTKTKDPS